MKETTVFEKNGGIYLYRDYIQLARYIRREDMLQCLGGHPHIYEDIPCVGGVLCNPYSIHSSKWSDVQKIIDYVVNLEEGLQIKEVTFNMY